MKAPDSCRKTCRNKWNFSKYGRDRSGPGPFSYTHQLLDMDVMNVPRLTIPNAMEQIDNQGKLTLKSSYPYLERQADAFISFLQGGYEINKIIPFIYDTDQNLGSINLIWVELLL